MCGLLNTQYYNTSGHGLNIQAREYSSQGGREERGKIIRVEQWTSQGVPCGRTRTHAHLDKNGLREPRKRDGLSAEVLICTMDTYDKVRKPTVEL